MSENERGPIHTYEVTWRNGHVERIDAHQVSYTGYHGFLYAAFGIEDRTPPRPVRVQFHGEVDGEWRLILSTLEDEVVTIRDLTVERIPGARDD